MHTHTHRKSEASVKTAAKKAQRAFLMSATAISLVLNCSPSFGADAAEAASTGLEEIVITGSRIVRDGYEAPTPLTVIGADALEKMTATANMADTLNLMPVFGGSFNPTQGGGVPSSGNAGINALNLRNLGTNRTLVLIDGHRVVQTLPNGTIDVNTFPQQLVSRVDVVTGGASAVYGSDAVSGVVNFVLDRNFTGVKGEVSGGLTSHGDNPNGKVVLSAGIPFGGGRGHVLLSGEFVYKKGIIFGTNGRKWNRAGFGMIQNPNYRPTNGQPEYFIRNDVGLATATHGGIVISGPLKGLAFGEGGVPYKFNYGSIISERLMAGGDWESTDIRDYNLSMDPRERRMNAFLRADYDISDSINVFAETAWNDSRYYNIVSTQYEPGNGPTILSGNPFIPASVQAQMTALGVTSLRMGSMNMGMPDQFGYTNRISQRNLIGAEGSFAALDTDWSWSTYAQYSVNRSSQTVVDVLSRAKYPKAIDAVRDPVTGAIVCRVTLETGEACVPWNYLGTGVMDESGAAAKYLFDDAHINQRPIQKVIAASITGNPFSTWAGPVSVALSGEYRFESGKNSPSEESRLNTLRAGNYQPFRGSYNVKEAAIETVVPLLGQGSDMSWDITGAARATDYSESGYVTTWKAGTTFSPIPDLRFRGTLSRDIRAPTLEDQFANNLLGFGSALDPFTNTQVDFFKQVVGNVNLKPEKANTLNLGVVVQPQFIEGLTFSVDYWRINLKDGINILSDQQAVTLCFEGYQQFCSLITRTNGVITLMKSSPQNFASQRVSGIDFEGSYRFAASDILDSMSGDFGLHANLTKNIKNITNPGIGLIVNRVGRHLDNGSPFWRLIANLDYTYEGLTATLGVRAFSDGVLNRDWVECTSGCPASTELNRTIDNNHVNGSTYLDLGLNYEFEVGFSTMETFLNVKNVLGSDPALVAKDSKVGFSYRDFPTELGLYDAQGRVFRAGIRFKM